MQLLLYHEKGNKMKKCFIFDIADRKLEIEAYGEKFEIVANSAGNQEAVKNAAEVLGSGKSASEKVSAVFTAVDFILDGKFSEKFFGDVETACYDEVMAFYNFLVASMVEHSAKFQEKYSPKRLDGGSKN